MDNKLILIRDYQEKQTLGEYLIYQDHKIAGIFKCLELPWLDNQRNISCIPEGKYKVVKRKTEKRGLHFHILDVPGRTWILLHPGNYYFDIQGCQLPGMSFTDINKDGLLDVTGSTIALNKMLELLPEEFEITITS